SEYVEFTGHRTQICEIMSTMDLLLIPSYNEAFARVALESIAAGVTLLGSRSGAFPRILENGKYGELVTPADPDAISEAALKIIANPASALVKLKEARTLVLRRYTKKESARRYARLYLRLAENFEGKIKENSNE
ncbi:MAG: glycosyltransferase family 4 protein, partial [Nitrospira sp.]|nr:glycosyltransferase family 4 protein [Nitrospira sp.]